MSPSAKKAKRSDQQEYEDLVKHVVLPRVLPQEKSPDLHGDEIHLMVIMVRNVERLAKYLPENTVGMFQRLKRVHQTRSGECIAREINSLQSGETFAMFIRRQNCAFMVHKTAMGNDVVVATFPGNLHPKEVYGHQSDIEFNYPVQALKAPLSKMLLSQEFADELCFLYQDQPIETKNRNYVHKWLMTILADESSTTADQFPKITKKIRDEVLGEGKSNYFRRSSFYMCLKVFLQHSLTMELDHERAKILYKIVMLQFHNCIMDVFTTGVYETLNIDLMSEIMAKSARRIEKLAELMKGGEGAEFDRVYAATVAESKQTIAKIRLKMDEQIGRLQNDYENKARLGPLTELDFPADIYQSIPKLMGHIEKRGKETVFDCSQSGLRVHPQYYRHYMDELHNPDVTKFGSSYDEIEVNLILSDFENFILYNSSSTDTCFGSDFLRTLSYGYASCAERFYEGDQVGTSKMVLVRLKLIAMLDAIAVKTHPLFADHHTSINTKIFETLLLPQRTDMQIAFELEQYFNSRNKAIGPGLISERSVTLTSFTAKFAAQNSKMQGLLKYILAMGEAEVEKKRQEWNTKRAEVERLRDQASRKTHEYYTNNKGYSSHSGFCDLCQLNNRIKSISMTQYERPLPQLHYEQNAVVFELMAPIEITCLRDVLFNFASYCHGQKYQATGIKGDWAQYHQIKCHNQSTSGYTSLGSTTSATLQTYHVDSSFENFIIKNGYNCTFHASHIPLGLTISIDFVKKSCTFKLDDEYSGLQWSLTGTSHTQNEVIARQSECPESISLPEFKNFGSLRADGCRLQLRKLYAMVETEALSFETTSVLSLLMQLLWEAGVSGADGLIRESFTDFNDPTFAHAMIELLSEFSKKQSNNWQHPKKLLMTVFIAVRVFEINDDDSVADSIVVLLEKIRCIALKWIDSIEGAINDIKTPDISAEQELRMKLALVAITGAITFFVHSRHAHFAKIFTQHSHRVWSQFVITLNSNVLLNPSTGSCLRMFLRTVRNTGIHIEATVRSMMECNPKDMHDIVKKQWKRAESATFGNYYFYHPFPEVLVMEVTVKGVLNYVTLDIITGSFLVNNFPVARLPSQITQSALFRRVFGTFVFEVQPDSNKSFSTVRRYNNCSYEFGWFGSEIIITERRDGIEMELVPHDILNGDVPYLLVQNYSHFWNKTDNIIELRPRCFTHKEFSHESAIEYKLDLNVRLLTHIKTKRHLLDINKGSYKKIVNQLSRLETSKFIHILMDTPQIAKVELVRMRLKFKVDCTTPEQSYDLLSNEFSRMRVSCMQNIGTLYGLQHGLLLESVPVEGAHLPSTRILILPHGAIHSTVTDPHVSVEIDLDADLRSPPFHQYEVDQICRQLKASNSSYSAWFNLAYLHAVTSHGEVEPFIKMSGTERALQILQSGFAWSSAPYDKEAADVLDMIGRLTPERKVKDSFQTVVWPESIPPHSAQDSFVFIATKLLEDSARLEGLHCSTPKQQQLKLDSQLEHNKRQYLRCLPLHPNLRASEEFIYHEVLRTTQAEPISSSKCPHTQKVSILYHRFAYARPSDFDLKSFLKSGSMLEGVVNKPVIPNLLHHQHYKSFVDLWISLYEYARNQSLNSEEFGLIWSLFVHQGQPLAPILALQSILMESHTFRSIDPPPMSTFHIGEGTYSAVRVSKMLEDCHSNPYNYDHKDFDRAAYDCRKRSAIDTMTRSVTSQWPCDNVSLDFSYDNFNLSPARRGINSLLKIWNDNRKLDIFIQKVQSALNSLARSAYVNIPHFGLYSNPQPLHWPRYESDWTNKMHEQLDKFPADIQEAEHIWKHRQKDGKSTNEWWNIFERIVNGPKSQHLIDAGIYPRVVPSLVLPKIANRTESSPLKMVIGALAMAMVREQHEKRIQIYSQRPELRAALEREIEHEPHINWNPCDYPEWILFEIEQNLMIRRIQIEIAKRMINPPDIGTKHSVMQLNMGEGKTAVIVPILASVLSDGQQACQITVLKSLFATNLKSLRRYLGGMLNRKVYVFPCRRDMPIGRYAARILDIYNECKLRKGVILTLPEYRLSFQLKIYESVKKSCLAEAEQFLAAHKWINSNVRSILDESDAILHPKYHLIYTVGNQQQLDGGSYRWLVVQSLLKRVPHHMRALNKQHGQEYIEFDENYVQNGHVYGARAVKYRPDVFTPCRILNERVYDELKKLLIEDFLEGRLNMAFPEITAEAKRNLRHLLTERNIDRESFDATVADFSISERNTIMILSGLLRFEVLKLILMRRWRVNYGVNVFGQRKMAIPFKAKDVAAEMTEFGHPDVAIGFTHLSYHYSGLTDCQLKETFKILSVSQNPASIYEQWIQSVQPELVDASIRTYTGVNLSDPYQRDTLLFPVFRFNMHVVDFWLSSVVFPREAKTFEKKLMCTAWDLCSEHMEHPVTGFSGTNDTKNILPMPIAQNDLAELEDTNENVRKILLRQRYDYLPANVSGTEIVEKLARDGIPVLLDSGALMLELNNKEVAEKWLELTSDQRFDAAIYFDRNDVLQTIDRNGIVTELDCSVYRDNLSRCLAYLDDVHTRGTDLKFPLEWQACVTLSGNITRDKTVQACMRMRQLGRGQRIVFWASNEADVRIRGVARKPHVTTEDVVQFICSNSEAFETDNTVHWATGAYNYTQKLIAHKLHESLGEQHSLQSLYELCADDEFVRLEEMYGDKEEAKLADIAWNKFDQLIQAHRNDVSNFAEGIRKEVNEKICKQASNVRRFIKSLDEEQEKELEHELEEERQVERPPPMSPAVPHFDKKLLELVLSSEGETILADLQHRNVLHSLFSSLGNTHLIQDYANEAEAWADHLFVTDDFLRVLSQPTSSCDEYLRPVWWIGQIQVKFNKSIVVLLSSFECDRLKAAFRTSATSVLYMYRPKLSKLHNRLLRKRKLQITGMVNPPCLSLCDQVQIDMYSGSMYFDDEQEQDAYCKFLGLIPRPRTPDQNAAFERGLIKPNGFVPMEYRKHSAVISDAVSSCKFNGNPVDLAIRIVQAHHCSLHEESHVASVLKRGTKLQISD